MRACRIPLHHGWQRWLRNGWGWSLWGYSSSQWQQRKIRTSGEMGGSHAFLAAAGTEVVACYP